MAPQGDIMRRRYADALAGFPQEKPRIPEAMQRELDHPENEPDAYKRRILEILHYHQGRAKNNRVHPNSLVNWYILLRTLEDSETYQDKDILHREQTVLCLEELEQERDAIEGRDARTARVGAAI
ncbi:hypothetical protein FJZ17_02310 [Candidatus Pacearchaeota archaeon]|nr:hypothetical protein [Candidatus Pacearchaeota archaeon]